RRRQAAARVRLRVCAPSPSLGLLLCEKVVTLLVDAEALVLVQELAPQQPARILPNPPQPLLGRLIRRPALELVRGDGRSLRRVRGLRLGGRVGLAGLRPAVSVLAVALRRRRVGEALVAVAGRVGRRAVGVSSLPLSGLAGLALAARAGLGLRAVARLAGIGRAVLSVGLVAPLVLLAVRLLPRRRLGRRLLLLEQFLEQGAIVASVVVVGIELERAIVRVDRGFDLAGPRERVPSVVMRGRGIEPAE